MPTVIMTGLRLPMCSCHGSMAKPRSFTAVLPQIGSSAAKKFRSRTSPMRHPQTSVHFGYQAPSFVRLRQRFPNIERPYRSPLERSRGDRNSRHCLDHDLLPAHRPALPDRRYRRAYLLNISRNQPNMRCLARILRRGTAAAAPVTVEPKWQKQMILCNWPSVRSKNRIASP